MGLFAGTQFDRPPHCERCEKLESECVCPPASVAVIPPEKQQLRIGLEKRKKGKLVTVIRDLAPQPEVVAELLTKLKTVCGAGGTQKDDLLEIQGDHLDHVQASLKGMGYRIKSVSR